MTIDDVSSGAGSVTAFNVKLTKAEQDQHAEVVDKLIDSTAATSPGKTQPGVGGLVNVVA